MKYFRLSSLVLGFLLCCCSIVSADISSLFADVLPSSSVALMSSVANNWNFDVSTTNEDVNKLVETLQSIRASTTSVSSSLLIVQALFGQLLKLNEVIENIKDIEGIALTDDFFDVEVAVKKALLQAASLGSSLQEILMAEGGSAEMLRKITVDVQSLGDSLKALESIYLFAGVDSLRNFEISPNSFNLTSLTSAIGNADLGSLGGSVFRLVDDFSTGASSAAGITVASVLNIVDLRGGFSLPADFGLGSVSVGNDLLSVQNLNLNDLSVGGIVADGLDVSADLKLPNVAESALDTTNDFLAVGHLDLKNKNVEGLFENDLNFEKEIDLGKIGNVDMSLGNTNLFNGKIDDKEASLLNVNNGGAASSISSKLIKGGSSASSNSVLEKKINLKELTANSNLQDQVNSVGGLTIAGTKIAGGAESLGDASVNLDVEELKADSSLDRSSLIGGAIRNSEQKVLVGGIANNSIDASNAVDLKEMTADLDLLALGETSGEINLPGNLGGLQYDISDLTDVRGHLDFKDLSKQSIEILKQTEILTTVDLPGNLDSITLEAHPSIDLSKLGRLNVLGFAQEFAMDVRDITEFNMLTETNLVKALTSGSEFLARLQILDALSNDIGTLTALPEVSGQVQLVLEDMELILEALKRVKLFPTNVRSLGQALETLNLGELNVELPELEAMSVNAANGIASTAGNAVSAVSESAASAIPNAAAALSGFKLDNFLDAAAIAEKISSTTLNVADVAKLGRFREGGNSLGIGSNPMSTALKAVPAITSGLGALATSTSLVNGIIGDANSGELPIGIQVPGLDLAALNLSNIVELANLNNIDLNDLTNLDEIVSIVNLDSSLIPDLENLVRLANIQNVNLNDIVEVASLNNLDINSLLDLSQLLNVDLTTVDFLKLGEMLNLEDIGLADVDLDLRTVLETANVAGIDLNDPESIPIVGDLVDLDVNQIADLENIVNVANMNGLDLTKVAEATGINVMDTMEDVLGSVHSEDLTDVLANANINEIGQAVNSGLQNIGGSDLPSSIVDGVGKFLKSNGANVRVLQMRNARNARTRE